MTHEEAKQFFVNLVKSNVQCQLTPGIIMDVEEVNFQLDEEKNLHVLVVVGDEEWNDNFELIFPAEKGSKTPTSTKTPAQAKGGERKGKGTGKPA